MVVCKNRLVRVEPVIWAFARHGCRFVVVGSVTRSWCGDDVVPHDLDLVVDGAPERRPAIVAALRDVGASVRRDGVWERVVAGSQLPWTWGFRARTPFVPVDVIVRFADGSTVDDILPRATTMRLPDGSVVHVAATRAAA